MMPTTTVQLTDAQKLRDAMEAAGKSSRALARAAEVSPARIQQLMSGRDLGIGASRAVAIATALDVDVVALFDFPDGESLIRLGLIRGV